MNDWLRQQINTAGSLFPVLTNQALDKNEINTPLEEAQKTNINQQQQKINQQKQELETQAKVNTGQALLLQGYQTEQETSRKENLVNDLMSGLNTKEYGLTTKALQTLEHLNDSDDRYLPIYFAKTESRMLKLKNSTGLFDIPLNDVKEITGGDETLANKLIKFVLDYNNLPEQKVTLLDGSVGYRIELEKPEKKNFSLNDLTLDLPKVTEAENLKGSPIINLDGIPYPNDTQKQAEIDNRKTVLEHIKEKVFPPVVTFLIGTGIGGLGANSLAPTPVKGIPDLLPNFPASPLVQGTAKKETLTDLEKNVSGMLQEQYPGYKALPEAHRQYLENHILSQSGAVSDVSGFPHSGTSIQDTAAKQGKVNQVTLPIPNPGDINKILLLGFGNPQNLNGTVPPYTMTQEQLTQTLNGN
jgi:hypothetical protein